jgi:lipopolysaccharide transport system ATP-binding protein
LSDIVVQCEGVSKKFCKSLKNSMFYGGMDILQSTLGSIPDPDILRPDEFRAIHDVSFELKRGDSFGIIGPNGSGKTTLLRMLNGIFMPDKGRITVKGKVGALIQVGAGFHPMLSGRENIYINGAILGMKRSEIDKKFDSIVHFADIGDFLDSPVKHYSSGMYVRLGFAIAVHSQPEILLIDEILAVGDKSFQIKCYQKMHEIQKNGTTIILVSHNEYTIREHTQQCLYLNAGEQKFIGTSEEAISRYIKEVYEIKLNKREAVSSLNKQGRKQDLIKNLKFLNKDGDHVNFIESGSCLDLIVELMINEPMKKPILGVNFFGERDDLVYCANSHYEQIDVPPFFPGPCTVKIRLPNFYLPTGDYLCSVVLSNENIINPVDWQDCQYKLVVGRAPNARGLLKLPTQWEFLNNGSSISRSPMGSA